MTHVERVIPAREVAGFLSYSRPRRYKRGHPWPLWMIDKLHELVAAGCSRPEIAERLGITRCAANCQIQRWGLIPERKPQARRWRILPPVPNPEPFTFPAYLNCVDRVVAATCHHFRIQRGAFADQRRTLHINFARQIGMAVAQSLHAGSSEQVARRFGRLDHTTALYAARRITARRAVEPLVEAHFAAVAALLAGVAA